MLKNAKLRTKLIAGFLAIAALATIIGITGYFGLNKSSQHIENIGLNKMPAIRYVLMLNGLQAGIRSAERIIYNPLYSLQDRKEQYQILEKAWKEVDEIWANYEKLSRCEEIDKLWQAISPVWAQWKKNHFENMKLVYEKDRLEENNREQNQEKIKEIEKKISGNR